jgi:hypothetical protein
MTRRLIITAAALVAAFLIAPLPAGAATASISGTVTGPGGTGLSGITVKLWTHHLDNDPDQLIDTTTTDGSGHYVFTLGVATAPLDICFSSPDYVRECYDNAYQYDDADGVSRAGTPVPATEAGTIANAQLSPGGTISGVVRNNHDQGLAGMQVRAQRSDDGWQFAPTSQSTGTYQFTKLPPGTYTICAWSSTIIRRCTGDVGGPQAYVVPEAGGSQFASDLVFVTAPENVRVSGTGVDRIQWSWDAVPGGHYRVAISTSPLMSNPIIKTTSVRWASFTGLKKNTLYYVVVRAFDNESTTAGSTKTAGKTGVVARPVGVHPDGMDVIDWSWAPYAGAAKYLVKMRTGSTWVGAEQHTLTGTTITLSVERDSCADLKVIALNKLGKSISTWSAPGTGCVPYHPV